MYEPEIIAEISYKLPKFELTVDIGDEAECDGSRDFVCVFESSRSPHTINFYGPTPEHAIGSALLYAQRETAGQSFDIVVDAAPEVELTPLP